ncbi:GNAT family N-acetyltransferase [Brevibacterium sp. FAM 25378]|uniref:GNAT family N-acetyltransferase n=1 Tax=unclassified Brevibacterium TaxID=2614124 RepID=UPI001091A8A8|nr:GNAT family N-acetyltransferase [Brevibacterium sp. S22]TGD28028.1 GNAT family N-acetyltransferase [Brevibacterium sp. S22]
MDLTISSLADRPDLKDEFLGLENTWPEFIRRDPTGDLYYARDVLDLFADYVLLAHTAADEIVGKAHSIPFRLGGENLPEDGWDGVIRRGIRAELVGEPTDTLAALEIFVRPDRQGLGLSGTILAALRDHARNRGFAEVVVPVRPNGKTDVHEPMDSYAFRTRDDGLPVDPWLRTHIRAGGTIDGVAHRAMVIAGTLDEWRTWTGLEMDESGPVDVPGALAPVLCDVAHGSAVYVEPNVWVRHRTGLSATDLPV